MKHHCIKKCVGTYLWIIFLTIALTACGHSKEAILLEQIESTKSDQSVEDVEGETSIENKEEQFLSVYICGAVKHPDVYQLLEGARIKDAVEKAGGFSKKADKNVINLAEKVTDGQQIYIPEEGSIASSEQVQTIDNNGNTSTKIDLNTATKEQLMTLPGIGESKADAILAYREENGVFQTTEDLKKISGIKDGVFQKLKDLIIVH